MKINIKEVFHIANLSRLKLEDNKAERFANQMSDILVYMDKLSEVDTTAVEAMYSPLELPTILREDIAKSQFTRSDLLENAANHDEEYFIVPKIV